MLIIPAIDIINGKCVRLTKGDYNAVTEYAENPAEVARYFEQQGAKKIHVVDLDGAKTKKMVNLAAIKYICQSVQIPVQAGGGIRTKQDLKTLFELGISQAIIGSLAVTDPDRVTSFIQQFGTDRIQVSIDVMNGVAKISGWVDDTKASLNGLIADMTKRGVTTFIVTDIARDGTLTSPNFTLYKDLIAKFPKLFFIASGGVSSKSDIDELRKIGVSGAVIGKALYENKIAFPTP